jgi:hypothetical protein
MSILVRKELSTLLKFEQTISILALFGFALVLSFAFGRYHHCESVKQTKQAELVKKHHKKR